MVGAGGGGCVFVQLSSYISVVLSPIFKPIPVNGVVPLQPSYWWAALIVIAVAAIFIAIWRKNAPEVPPSFLLSSFLSFRSALLRFTAPLSRLPSLRSSSLVFSCSFAHLALLSATNRALMATRWTACMPARTSHSRPLPNPKRASRSKWRPQPMPQQHRAASSPFTHERERKHTSTSSCRRSRPLLFLLASAALARSFSMQR